jgi:hypothetical protein
MTRQDECRERGICPVPAGQWCKANRHARYCDLAAQDQSDLAANPGHNPYWLNFLSGMPQAPQPAPAPAPPPAKPPPIVKRMWNFATAFATWARDDFRHTSEATQADRRATCNACDRRRSADDMCLECGCYLYLKIPLAAMVCPKGYWLADPALEPIDQATRDLMEQLTPAQRTSAEQCPARTTRGCCSGGVTTVCGQGYYAGEITPLDCARCVLQGWSQTGAPSDVREPHPG